MPIDKSPSEQMTLDEIQEVYRLVQNEIKNMTPAEKTVRFSTYLEELQKEVQFQNDFGRGTVENVKNKGNKNT